MNTTPRRTLLQRGLALLTGGVALATGYRVVRADARIASTLEGKLDPKPPGRTLMLYAQQRPITAPPAGSRPARADTRQLAAGDLLDAPNGRRVGTVHTNCFCSSTPLGPHRSASDLEFQVLQLADGTLFGMSGGDAGNATKVLAIVGGTGQYAGARGTTVQRSVTAHRDIVEFVVTLDN